MVPFVEGLTCKDNKQPKFVEVYSVKYLCCAPNVLTTECHTTSSSFRIAIKSKNIFFFKTEPTTTTRPESKIYDSFMKNIKTFFCSTSTNNYYTGKWDLSSHFSLSSRFMFFFMPAPTTTTTSKTKNIDWLPVKNLRFGHKSF